MSLPVSGNYYGAGAGVDGYAGKFIPEVWSGKLAVKFYAATCLSEITNTDWEGEIRNQGDKVKIRTVPNITIRDYQKGLNLTHEVPATTVVELNIDKGKYFAVVVDDVDKVQTDIGLMETFTNDAAEQMKIAVEQTVFQSAYTGAAPANRGATAGVSSGNINLGATGSPLAISATNVLDWIVDMGLVLDEQHVPETGRWLIIPPAIAARLKKSDLKNASITGDGTSVLRNGRLGTIDRFTLYSSNTLHKVTDGAHQVFNVMAGTRDAISFASQITNTETLRSPSTFGSIVRGLNVFGFAVTKPEALVHSRVRLA